MSRKKNKKRLEREAESFEPQSLLSAETKKSVGIVVLLASAFISFLSLFDLAGKLGFSIKEGLGLTFGWGLYVFPIILIFLAVVLLFPRQYKIKPSNYMGLFFLILSYSGLLQFFKDLSEPAVLAVGKGGGYLGYFIYLPLQNIMGSLAAVIAIVAVLFISLLITFNTSLAAMASKANIFNWFRKKISTEEGWQDEEKWSNYSETESNGEFEKNETAEDEAEAGEDFSKKKIPVRVEGVPAQSTQASGAKSGVPDGIKVTFSKARYKKVQVPLNMLEGQTGQPTSGDIQRNSEIIKAALSNFGIEVDMDEVNVGPTVTQFTFKPHQGVKLAQITTLQNDLALALAAHPIRIEAPIPGKSLVGLEIPNQSVAIVKLKNIIGGRDFQKKKGYLKFGLGQDVSGRPWAVDIAALPHLLIAGATGSGKSVCINSIIVSLLFQHSPDSLRFIIIDPKRVELTNYNGIPHLLTPVITEVDKTVNSLRWLVKEMDMRFKLLHSVGKRNIEAYNESVLTNKLPYIVLVVDELADLMAVAARDVEAVIVRLAQMARAVGIHLILATQRPSVNVITGLIKANVPARIAFAVASQVDSRTILDASGAEKLLGKGDLLFTSAELGKPRRIQGAFLSDEEIERVINFWKQQTEPEYNEDIIEAQGSQGRFSGFGGSGSGGDELLEEAKDIVIRAGKASASLLQRRLRVGYARAARLLDLLEEQGVIGPGEGARPREILASDKNVFGIPAETTEAYANESDNYGEENFSDKNYEAESSREAEEPMVIEPADDSNAPKTESEELPITGLKEVEDDENSREKFKDEKIN